MRQYGDAMRGQTVLRDHALARVLTHGKQDAGSLIYQMLYLLVQGEQRAVQCCSKPRPQARTARCRAACTRHLISERSGLPKYVGNSRRQRKRCVARVHDPRYGRVRESPTKQRRRRESLNVGCEWLRRECPLNSRRDR
jgi:hypothetical protein